MELVQLLINGTTSFSTMIAELIEMEGLAKVVAYTTKSSFIKQSTLKGKEIILFEEIKNHFDSDKYRILNTIGYSKMNTVRERVNKEIESTGLRPFSYISKHAFISPSIESSDLWSSGCIIMPSVFIGSNVKLGKSTIIYSHCSLTHDIIVADNVFLASGCIIGGYVNIGHNCFVGMNATIKNRVSLGAYTLVGCGSNVLESITDEYCVVVGNPAGVLTEKNSLDSL